MAGIGPIRTFDDLVKAASATNKDGVAGFVGRGRRGFDIAWVWLGYFLGLGGTVMKDGKSGVNTDAGHMASEIYLNKLLKANGPQGSANMSWLEASTVFKDGKAALYTDASGLLAVTIDKTSSKVSDDEMSGVCSAGRRLLSNAAELLVLLLWPRPPPAAISTPQLSSWLGLPLRSLARRRTQDRLTARPCLGVGRRGFQEILSRRFRRGDRSRPWRRCEPAKRAPIPTHVSRPW